MRVRADGSAPPAGPQVGPVPRRQADMVRWIRQPVVSPTARPSRWSRTAATRRARRRAPVLQPQERQVTGPTCRSRRRSATRTRPGGRTASSCCTSATVATGATGAPVIYRYDVEGEGVPPADVGRLPPALVLARREVHRGDPDEHARHRRRDPRRPATGPSCCASPTTALWAPDWSPGRRRDRVPHIDGQSRRPPAGQARRHGPELDGRRGLPLTDVSGLDAASRPDWFIPAERAAGGIGPSPGPRDRRRTSTGWRPAPRDGDRPVPRARPRPRRTARRVPRDLAGVERFAELLLEAALPYAAAVKPNLAFFEAFGSAGMAALERLRAAIPADIPVVADAKRGDIGSTAARQAVALFDVLGADAVTVNPYLGEEAIAPLLERADRFAYVLCRTSNPGAGELQGLRRRPRTPPRTPRRSRSTRGSRGARPAGARAARSGSSSGRPPRMSCAPIRAVAPGLAFLVPGRRRPGRRDRAGPRGRSGDRRAGRRAPRRRAAGERVAGHRGRRVGRRRRRPARPAGARRGGRPRLGRTPPCATLAAAGQAAVASVRRTVPPFPDRRRTTHMPISEPPS